jgi:hypothetical protein
MTESIYNLVPVEYAPEKKAPMYRSKHDPLNSISGSTFGKLSYTNYAISCLMTPCVAGCFGSSRLPGAGSVPKKEGALFGPPNEKYLQLTKRSASNKTSEERSTPFHYNDRRKEPTPPLEAKPIVGVESKKNFVVSNAIEVILKG